MNREHLIAWAMMRCEKSFVGMVAARLATFLSTPIALVLSLIRRVYRVIFWSDKRWLRHRVYSGQINEIVEHFFKEATEDEIDQLIGFEMQFMRAKKDEKDEPNSN